MKRIAGKIVGCAAVVMLLSASGIWVGRWEASASAEGRNSSKSRLRKVDVNTASARELERVLGLRPDAVERVRRNRPYRKLDELIARKVLSRKEFARIKERVRVSSAQ